jgi:hypothetical protein
MDSQEVLDGAGETVWGRRLGSGAKLIPCVHGTRIFPLTLGIGERGINILVLQRLGDPSTEVNGPPGPWAAALEPCALQAVPNHGVVRGMRSHRLLAGERLGPCSLTPAQSGSACRGR